MSRPTESASLPVGCTARSLMAPLGWHGQGSCVSRAGRFSQRPFTNTMGRGNGSALRRRPTLRRGPRPAALSASAAARSHALVPLKNLEAVPALRVPDANLPVVGAAQHVGVLIKVDAGDCARVHHQRAQLNVLDHIVHPGGSQWARRGQRSGGAIERQRRRAARVGEGERSGERGHVVAIHRIRPLLSPFSE